MATAVINSTNAEINKKIRNLPDRWVDKTSP